MKRIRRVSEAEVVAEFLKNEFYQEEFHRDREQFEKVVFSADISNESENEIRRALLFRRRGHMWRELPLDTEWWEIEIEPEDLQRLRVFPRANWRRISDGSFLLSDIVRRLKTEQFSGKVRDFIAKIHSLSYRLRVERDPSSVLLIGIDEWHPMTILEGNHRLAAACLISPELPRTRFRVLVGLSPRMVESCWYETNFSNLWRYAKNRMRNLRGGNGSLDALPMPTPAQSFRSKSTTQASSVAQRVRSTEMEAPMQSLKTSTYKMLVITLMIGLCGAPELVQAAQQADSSAAQQAAPSAAQTQSPATTAPAPATTTPVPSPSGTSVDPASGPLEPVPPSQEPELTPIQSAPTGTPQAPPVATPNAETQTPPTPSEPVGTATAQRTPTSGGAASKPAGTAIAPAKQRQVHSLFVKLGLVAGAAVAIGAVAALSHGTPSTPPGAAATK